MFCSKATTAEIMDQLIIDSAGTHYYRVGEPPDPRAQDAASKRGYDLSALRARKIALSDFDLFDYIIAMDMKNMAALESLREGGPIRKPELMMSFSRLYKDKDVPDPYGGGDRDFELVLDMLESATDGLLAVVKQNLMRREKIR